MTAVRTNTTGFRRAGALAALSLLLAASACSDGSVGLIGSGSTGRVEVDVSGPQSSLGAWRYYDGVRLLECDVRITASAYGGSEDASAEWLDGRVDLYDLRDGRYLGSDYMYPGEVADLWGSRVIENGEDRVGRLLSYASYGAFRAYFVFRYESMGRELDTEHRFDCR